MPSPDAELNVTTALQAALLDQLGLAVLVLDSAWTLRWANARARQYFPLDEAATLANLVSARDEHDSLVRKLALNAHQDINQLHMHGRDGQVLIMAGTATTFHDEASRQSGVMLVLRDVAEALAEEASLRLSAKVFEYSGEAIMITDPGDRILAVNAAFTALTGYEFEEVKGRTPEFLGAGQEAEGFYEAMWAAVHRDGHWKGEVWNRKKNGEVYPEWLAITAVRNRDGDIDHYITIFSDITERKAEEEHIRHQAQHDFLTGLPNRVLLQDRFEQAVALSKRGRPHPIALMFIDLDGFKAINDDIGHGVGDKLLQEVARRLSGCVRETDTVCRHGGDEFIVLLPDIGSGDFIPTVADKILAALRQEYGVDNHRLRVSASIGISLYPRDGEDLKTLMRQADLAMYESKRGGKNAWTEAGVLSGPDQA